MERANTVLEAAGLFPNIGRAHEEQLNQQFNMTSAQFFDTLNSSILRSDSQASNRGGNENTRPQPIQYVPIFLPSLSD